MTTIALHNAEQKLGQLISESQTSHQPIHIVGETGSAVLLSEEDWTAIEETLALNSIPGMVERLHRGRNEPIEECSTELDW